MGAGAPSGLVSMLFSDIEGSTWMLQQLGEAFDDVVLEHRRLLRDAWSAHGGFEVGTEGDSFFVVFPDASSAVAAAVAGQRALRGHPWPEGAVVRVRMGIHTGDARYEHGDYFGLAVHQAARVASSACGDQVIITDATRAAAEGVEVADLGLHRLKDLTEPFHLYQVVADGLPSQFPPPRTLTVLPNNFPVQATAFLGRGDDVSGVQDALGKSPLVTLTGTGGVGKSRLALQVAAEVIDDFRDGAWLVELAPVASEDLVASAVAKVLNVREQAGRPVAESLADALVDKQLLVVLDNCEHVIEVCAKLVHQLVSSCPHVKVLATSREALNIPAETEWRLRSLSPDESVALFTQRAAAVRSDFEASDLVSQICERLDGVPLAIELAAARTRSMSVADIAARLDDRFRLLTGGARTALPRQRTLEAAVSWSYNLLPETEQVFFDRLSVFAGGFAVEAAQAVAAVGELDVFDVIDLLDRMVDRSLVVAETANDGATRYRLLETLRQFGHQRLVERKGLEMTRNRHLDFFCGLAATFPQLSGNAPPPGMLLDEDNFRAAISWATESGNKEAALRLTGAVWAGHFDERRRLYEELLPPDESVDDEVAGRALFAGGALAFMMGDWTTGAAHFEQAAERAGRCGDGFIVSMSHTYGGVCLLGEGDSDGAIALIDGGLAEALALEHPVATCRALMARGWIDSGFDLDAAEAAARRGIDISRPLADPFELGHHLELLGYVQCVKGDLGAGAVTLAEASLLFKTIQHNCASHILENAAACCAMRGRHEEGAELWGAADRIRAETLDKPRPWEQQVQEVWLPAIAAALPADTLSAVKLRGAQLDVHDALDYAASVLRDDTAER